jgi:hypothetical protein
VLWLADGAGRMDKQGSVLQLAPYGTSNASIATASDASPYVVFEGAAGSTPLPPRCDKDYLVNVVEPSEQAAGVVAIESAAPRSP